MQNCNSVFHLQKYLANSLRVLVKLFDLDSTIETLVNIIIT